MDGSAFVSDDRALGFDIAGLCPGTGLIRAGNRKLQLRANARTLRLNLRLPIEAADHLPAAHPLALADIQRRHPGRPRLLVRRGDANNVIGGVKRPRQPTGPEKSECSACSVDFADTDASGVIRAPGRRLNAAKPPSTTSPSAK